MPKLQRMKTLYFISIPKKIVEAFGWQKGDVIKVHIKGKDRLELVKE
jgi:bifunctional DNA-binding transcriptional regulator/antitoxin component of YhaV-PrlF toxin-antitoxin module